ncbi:MAG: hypothetical protein ABSE96_12765, partial [Terracidiphilus sp.]
MRISPQFSKDQRKLGARPPNRARRLLRLTVPALACALTLLAGCGGVAVTANSTNDIFVIAPATTQID